MTTLLKLPEREASEQEIILQAVKQWLQTQSKWLLILDNADDLNLLPAYLPPVSGGHILLTTRAWDMQRLAQRVEVGTLPDEMGALFLLRRAALMAPDAELSQVSIEERQLATQVTQELGGLPLALDQAGAYLEATGMSLAQYQQVYQQHRKALLQERRARMTDHPEPVATTWSLSFERVEEQNKASADLLRLCAYLAPDAIPENIITQGAPHLGPLLVPVAADPFLLSQAIEALRVYSLIQRDPRTQTLSVHRLVQAVLHDSMETGMEQEWKQRAVRAVSACCPKVSDVTEWNACEQWLPHAQVCATWIEQEGMTLPEAARMLNEAGYYLGDRARYSEAEPLFRRALEIYEEQLGPHHPDTARSLNNLAALYDTQGKYSQAEPLLKRALEIREEQLGPHHPDTALSLNNLASLYNAQGKCSEAEPLYRRALEIYEEQLGPHHPDTALSLNNLAMLYKTQGKYSQAEPLLKRALEIREKQLGPHHPDTALSLNNLASLYNAQGKYSEAEPLYRRALEIYEEQLGPHHPDTARSLNNLAMLYKTQGKYSQAEPLYLRALEIRETLLGEHHPDTALSLNNLASLYNAQGKYSQAEPLFRRALEIREEQLGPHHPDTALSLNNLAALYDTQGKYSQAEPLLKRALEIYETQLGADHPHTVIIRANYTACSRKMEADGT
jgi:tetratricopeptide (TPR) repeat protein